MLGEDGLGELDSTEKFSIRDQSQIENAESRRKKEGRRTNAFGLYVASNENA